MSLSQNTELSKVKGIVTLSVMQVDELTVKESQRNTREGSFFNFQWCRTTVPEQQVLKGSKFLDTALYLTYCCTCKISEDVSC